MSDCIVRNTTTSAQARRLYEKKYGPLSPDIKVCHTCDNHFCLNEDHWFLGTQSDNMKDMVAKGRNYTGRGNSKLTEDLVRMIRSSDRSGEQLARELGITRHAVNKARKGTTWKNVV